MVGWELRINVEATTFVTNHYKEQIYLKSKKDAHLRMISTNFHEERIYSKPYVSHHIIQLEKFWTLFRCISCFGNRSIFCISALLISTANSHVFMVATVMDTPASVGTTLQVKVIPAAAKVIQPDLARSSPELGFRIQRDGNSRHTIIRLLVVLITDYLLYFYCLTYKDG